MDRSDKVFLLLVLVALAAAVGLAAGRARIEQANRAVELIIDADDARQLAMRDGVPLAEVLAALGEAGASAVAVREMTIADLVDSSRATAMSTSDRTNLMIHDPELAIVLGAAIVARIPQVHVETAGSPAILAVNRSLDQLAEVPVILRPEDIRAAREAGLRVVARLRNFPAASAEAIEAAAAEAQAAGARLIIFDKEEILGRDGLLSETAAALRKHDLLFGYVEMAGQMGARQIGQLLASRLVRVHSISESDLLGMVPEVAVPRYARAVRERNIRACYVRLMVRPHPDPVRHNVRYVRRLTDTLVSEGSSIGAPAPFAGQAGWPPRWPRALVALGLPAALVLLLRRMAPLPAMAAWAVFAAAAGTALVIGVLAAGPFVQLGGIAVASVFPTLGTLSALHAGRAVRLTVSARELVGTALSGLLFASAISITGGLLIVGLYSDIPAVAGIHLFSGVKLSLVTPLALIAITVVAGAPGYAEPLGRWWSRTRLRFAEFLGQRVALLQALVVLAALGGLMFVLTRSGNQPLVAPSAVEASARQLLESLLVIRPRTKEFLLGHPALMLGVALSLRGRRAWLPVVALIGGLGQVSLINTFCHFHTPLYVSFLRAGHGLWIGALVGAVTVLVWRLLFDRTARPRTP